VSPARWRSSGASAGARRATNGPQAPSSDTFAGLVGSLGSHLVQQPAESLRDGLVTVFGGVVAIIGPACSSAQPGHQFLETRAGRSSQRSARCRRSWKCSPETPACSHAAFQIGRKFDRRRAAPFGPTKTRPPALRGGPDASAVAGIHAIGSLGAAHYLAANLTSLCHDDADKSVSLMIRCQFHGLAITRTELAAGPLHLVARCGSPPLSFKTPH
jgi:hypothetical protein